MVKGDDDVGTFYEYDEELIRKIRDYIYENDMTYTDFAKSVGCSPGVISKFVRKQYKLGRNVKRKLARKVGMDEDHEADLYNYHELTSADKREYISIAIDDVISKLEVKLNECKSELYKLEYARDRLQELLKGL